MGSALKASYGKLLSVALAAILVFAVYAPIQMPLPQAMAASIQITNQTTCVALPAEVSPEWIDPTCQIDTGTLVVAGIIRVHQHVVLEITSSSGIQLNANATLDNDGAINNGGFLTINSGAVMDNPGSFTNTGTILNQGSISSTGNFTNSGVICGPGTVEGTISGNPPTEDCEDGGDEGNDEDTTGSVTGFKFNDENGNGVWDMDEGGSEGTIGGIEICADGEGMEEPICDFTSGESGAYTLANLPSDVPLEIYENVSLEEYEQTAPVDFENEETRISASNFSYFVTLNPGDTIPNLNFGNLVLEFGSISGIAFVDFDANGALDENDFVIEEVDVCVSNPEEEFEQCGETNGDGVYSFEDVPAGNVEVNATLPGYELVYPTEETAFEDESVTFAEGIYTISLEDDGEFGDIDFGFQELDGAIIGNGQVILGVDEEGQLNIEYRAVEILGLPGEDPIEGEEIEEGELPVGLRDGSGEFSAVEQGTPSEGWGIAGSVSDSAFAGFANNNDEDEDRIENAEVESFAGEDGGETAESVVIVRDSQENPAFRITHHFGPSEETPDLYKITVTVENIGEEDVGDVIYRRAMDWDIDPTPFNQFVTIQGAENNTLVLNSGNNGFIGMDILEASAPEDFRQEDAPFSIEQVYKKDFEDLGPGNHGAAFDFSLGDIPAGEFVTMTIFYGAAFNEQSAIDALDAEEVQMYSLAQSMIDEENEAPNNDGEFGPTFMFALGEITEADDGINSPPVAEAGPAQTVDDSALVTLDGTGSSDEESDLEYSWTQLSGPAVTLTGNATANPTFTAPSNVNTELSFNLTVTDGDGASDSATVSITVLGRGDITIRKIEQGTGTLLAGSAFTITPNPLTPTGTPTGSLTVADGGENDSDPADGVIKVAGVRFSTYTLVESQVPANHTKLVNSQTVVVNNGNPTPTVTVQNLHVEEEIEDEVELPPPQLDEEEVEDLEDNGAKVDGQNVNGTNLPPAVITPPGQTPQVPKPVVFTNTAPPSTNGSSLFASFGIPTYQAPQQSIANQTVYSPPAFVVPKANGSNFVLTPVIEEIFEGMTMLLTPPDDTAVTSASIQSVEIEFGQGGNDTGFSFDLSDDIPEGLPELDDIEEAALFLDVDFVGNVNFSDPNAFASPPEFTISVSRTLGGEDLPDGCPDVQLYLLNENTDEWETVETPERNPDGDTADECSYIVHTEHFSKFTIGSVKASISNVADSPGGGGGGGSRTVSVDGTFGQEYFDVNPLAKVSISGTAFIAPDGRSDNTFATGEQVHFTNTIRSHQRDPQPYIFVVQVLDSDGITQSLSWQSGLLDRAQEFDVGQSWLAEEAGDYQVRIYVWSGWDQPDPLSNVTVKVLKVTDLGPSQSA